MSSKSQLPITDAEANAALERLFGFVHIVLAVSGGPDSMALLVLAAEWQRRHGAKAPALSAATVDHELRVESRSEAEFVAHEVRRLGLDHVILSWVGDKPTTGRAEKAREARYGLLEAHARALGANAAVVTAHHRDDQAETFAMRLARGSGIDGLAAMSSARPVASGSSIWLVRPFLHFPKSRLVATLVARGIGFVDDPTNRDRRYERPRIRQTLPILDEAGISPDALAMSARRLGAAKQAIDYAEDAFIATLSLSFGNEVFASFDRRAFDRGPTLLRQRVLARLIARYGGASQRPQLGEVEDLASRIERDAKCVRTLGGVMISAGARFIRLWREAGRLSTREINLAAGESLIWDRRFLLRCSGEGQSSVMVKPLGPEHYRSIADRLVAARKPPARATYGLPSFWSDSKLLAVPSLAPFASRLEAPLTSEGCDLHALATIE